MRAWDFYTSNELKPKGWVKRQLEIQADGLSGNLDKVWRDVRDSSWIGGDAEGWERVPYWLDGFVPLAYLLENENMIARAKRYIDAIIARQEEDGWICPCSKEERPKYDTWAVQLITKVLTVYYECSRDERVPDVVYNILKNYYTLLCDETVHLFAWGKFRWFECFIAIEWLYSRCKEDWLIDLAKILRQQGQDYLACMQKWERPLNAWTYETHIVNICMALKYEALTASFFREDYSDRAEEMYKTLNSYNGTPVGTFTGDECLSGLSPIQGTELCSVVEQMYSYEILYACTGDRKWAERLELLAFNALPATISDDMWTHQYVQMSNQIACQRFPGKSVFRTNGPEAHLFGLEPNYGCCTANFNQGWPKFVLSAFMHREKEILHAIPVPSELNADGVHILCETAYPFDNSFVYTIDTEKEFVFHIRIPSFAKNIRINETPFHGDEAVFTICSGEHKKITITYDCDVCFNARPNQLTTVQRGSLIFSVPITHEKRMREYVLHDVERKFPYCDYEFIPTSDWNYAYSSKKAVVEHQEIGEYPFSSTMPPLVIHTNVQKIDWGFEDGYNTVCAKVPASRNPIGEVEEIQLYPYGCAKLRMTEIPLLP